MSGIKTVTIRRFKRLNDVTINIGQTSLLIGANNSGKSSILQAIHFAVSIAQTARLVGEGVSWRNDTYELSFNPAQLLYSPVADVLSLATGGVLQEQRPTQIEIELVDDEENRCTVGLRRGRNRNIAISIVGKVIGEKLMNLENPYTVYAPGLAGIPKEERFLSAGVVRRFVARGDANLALRNVLRMLRSDQLAWDLFLADMRSIFPGIDISIIFNENVDENIQVYFELPGVPRLPIDAAGTSILQASQILAYISLFKPQILILDEPDSHLHPDNQRALCELVFRLTSERNFQAMISTHSRHVLDTMKNKVDVFWLNKGHLVDQPDLNTTSMLLELGALDSVDYFADGATRCVVATEDAVTDPIKALLFSNNFSEEETEIASYTGCSKIESAMVLGKFLNQKAPNVKLVIHRDRDYLSVAAGKSFENQLRGAELFPFLTDQSDVESYFINAAHLAALNPPVTVARMEELIEAATTMTADKSISAIINQRTTEAFKNRQANGNVNHGQIAVQATADYAANPQTLRRGKIVLGQLAALLQQETGTNPRIFFASEHLTCQTLSDIAREIWAG